jgi:hypothetical protein
MTRMNAPIAIRPILGVVLRVIGAMPRCGRNEVEPNHINLETGERCR